ncbi:3'(2'),5'-bisphosphate nucleotidase CysQ [Aquicoccus sp. G2-2]|uniref:3'(2'),5'-bisphosphate nucleotidase CysQ n=1 Tax=Aquicoccus sp. G2-2 TaxID=3092120 RepID=UPI002ADF23CF|nr:3'(2'),5'-bisphosphate nucleotidase CysQ [Aquicoccus sp. G2-2]MEA1114426.1 3'(2'),5'-bisphosphate nucleotidase CysQ [Aquicoccus sp. G2-2]
MPGADLELLIDAAREAGRIAREYCGETVQKWDKPDDAGPVTEADLAVNRMLNERLRGARPGYGWLSEESEDSAERLARERVFIVDPLDGTRNFIEGGKSWAHALAIVEHGRPVAGVVYLPLLERLYAAEAGLGATLNGAPIAASTAQGLAGATLLAARPALGAEHWKGGVVPDVERVYRPSLAYRLSLVAEGRFDSMLTLRDSWEWDIAAGAAILGEAGAVVTDRHGQALRFNNAVPMVAGVVAGAEAVQRALRGALV